MNKNKSKNAWKKIIVLDTPADRLNYTHTCLMALVTPNTTIQSLISKPSLEGQNIISNKNFFYTANDAKDLNVVNCVACHDLIANNQVDWIQCQNSFIPLCSICAHN
jgi:hypothetical protein